MVIGSTGVVKGDFKFSNNLRAEDGTDIEGYIKKTAILKRKLLVIFLFSKIKKKKKKLEKRQPETSVNKETRVSII